MKITRIDGRRNLDKSTVRLELDVGVGKFTLTEEPDGALLVHRKNGERINVVPRCRNEFEIY